MKAILTRYLPATNYRGSRIKASAEGVPSLTIGYPHEYNTSKAHGHAAKLLRDRQGWNTRMVGGGLPNGDYCWCFDVDWDEIPPLDSAEAA